MEEEEKREIMAKCLSLLSPFFGVVGDDGGLSCHSAQLNAIKLCVFRRIRDKKKKEKW